MSDKSPIAVVGFAYRAPGVGSKGLWDFLADAKSAWTKMPADRFDHDAFYSGGKSRLGCYTTEGAHFLPDNIYGFDAAFFNMRAEEARNSDPQHRMMLECAFEAAENAGQSILDLAGKNIGVYIGCAGSDYTGRMAEDLCSTSTFAATGSSPCMAANRLSYFFDIHGPSVAMEAACASSIYATHTACQAIRNGDCDAAFVGSAQLTITPNTWIGLEKMGALASGGRSYSYDHKASGFGRGEGAVCMLIKRLDAALRDGDPVHSVILNSACNHSGRSEGITMPSRKAQETLLREVHEAIGLNPSETPVAEGHGTGTAAGDPIEAGAFSSVLAKERTTSNPHLEGASGIIGIIKAILMIKRGIILPTAGFEKFNPEIEGSDRLKVAKTTIPWPKNELKRVVITNFGFGGSNSAVLLEEAPPSTIPRNGYPNKTNGYSNGTNGYSNGINGHSNGTNGHSNGTRGLSSANLLPQRLFVFTAKTEKSLLSYLSSFSEYLDTAPDNGDLVEDLSYTLGERRTHHAYRISAIADSMAGLKEKLSTAKPKKIQDRVIAFAFTGQGAGYAQMASGLWHYKAFAAAMDQAEAHLREIGASWSLREELAQPVSDSRVNAAEISQPACTAVQLALTILLKSWGVSPTMVTGHSSGEIAAAFTAGLISFRAAIAIAYFRGQAAAQLIDQQSQKGSMLALGIGFEEASELIKHYAKGYATVAATNSPQSVTLSGDQSAIDNILKIAEAKGLFVRRLKIEVAYHSRHMESVASSYLAAIKPFCIKNALDDIQDDPRPVFVSSVTGRVADSAVVDATYWVKNLVQPVKFADAIESVFTRQSGKANADKKVPNVVIEIGPHSALKTPIKQTIDFLRQQTGQPKLSFVYLSTLVRGTSGDEALLDLAASVFTMGSSLQLGQVNQTNMHSAHVITDLPSYAWDKSVKYELNTRVAQEKLHPGEPYHPLLGRRSPSSGGDKECVYRQVFNLDDIPWIRDHNVAGNVVFPMTGYLSCAIEAVRRTVSTPPGAIVLRNVHVTRGLEIEEESLVDMTTKIRPAATGTENFSSTIWTFDVSTWTETNGWNTHCHGQIELEMDDMTIESPTLKTSFPLINDKGLKELDAKHNYVAAGEGGGTAYGPAFQNTVKFSHGEGFTVIENKLRDLETSLPSVYGSAVTIDPPTLDGFLQGALTLQEVDGKMPGAQMPNFISRFRISNNILADRKQKFTVVTRLLDYDLKGGRMILGVAAFADSITPIAEFESITFRTIFTGESDDPASALPGNWCWDLLPSFDFLPSDELTKRFEVQDVIDNVRGQNLNKAAVYYMDRALKETAQDDSSNMPHHLLSFTKWAARAVSREGLDLSGDQTAFLKDVIAHDAQGELLCAIGEQLVPILRGEVQPLEIMLKDGLLTRHYEADVSNAHFSQVLGEFARNISDLEPDLRILEIGGGTAGTTMHVLEALSRNNEGNSTLNYTFTDISSGFFENARTKLAKWSHGITYKKLDISQDPVSQGFTHKDYDLIIASNVLHATPNMSVTMSNVRNLLKPKGKLLLLEGNRHPAPTLPFALLPGWWYAEDEYRDHEEGPLLTVGEWNRLLSDIGFSGIDASILDYPGSPDQMISLISSTRIGKQETSQPITICGPFIDDEEVEFAQLVADSVSERLGCITEVKPLVEIDSTDDPYCIFIDSPRQSLLANVSSETFEVLKNFLLLNTGLLWVIPESEIPEAQSIKGMFATLRLENESKNLLWLDNVPCTPQGATAITKLAEKLRDPEVIASEDQDYVWNKGSIYLPRLRQMKEIKEQFAAEQGIPIRKVQKLSDSPLEMTVDAAGSLDSIYFRRTDILSQPVGADEVLVKVEATGMNFRDLLLVLGSIPWTPPGLEGVGTVIRAGSRVTDLKLGDRVFYGTFGGFATYLRMPALYAFRVPQNISSADAASIPIAYCTAVQVLMRIARLKKGESVLIHAASGAVGQACIMLAQHIGAIIYATAGTPTKRDFLYKTFAIPKAHIFSSRTSEFKDGILCATDNKGVDVVINSLAGSLLQDTWALIADFGRFVEIGKKDFLQNSYLPMKQFDRNVTFSGLDLRALFEKRPEEVRECMAEIADLLRRKIIYPIHPVTPLPISQIATGLRKLQSGQNIGKIVITFDKDDSVLAETLGAPSHMELNRNATYLISGGTKGIGLSLAYWMIENGAHNVAVLGRSGASGPEVQKLLEQYKGTKIRVEALACDVGSRPQLQEALRSIKNLPPVRGVVHSALFLNDALFENATYDDWQKITGPRVQGAWNLHELLPNLDFFVALSSFLGDTGNMGQCIYGGTAKFYDAFAKYRNTRGQNTVSVSLPVVVDVGYVKDRDLTSKLQTALGATLRMVDICTIVKGAAMGQSCPLHHNGRAITLKLSLGGMSGDEVPWKYFHPTYIRARLTADRRKNEIIVGSGGSATSWLAHADPLTGLIEALITKVSAMTMIERDEVVADGPLVSYGLDSLVSVELRNWIRRETGVDLALTAITQAANLRALATQILSQRGGAPKA